MIVRIRAEYDSEAAVWVAKGEDIPLLTEAKTIKALRAKLPGMIFDLVGEPTAALVRYAAPPGIEERHDVRRIQRLREGLTAVDRIVASLCATVWTAACWLVDAWRSQADAAARFWPLRGVSLSIRSQIKSSMPSSSIPAIEVPRLLPPSCQSALSDR